MKKVHALLAVLASLSVALYVILPWGYLAAFGFSSVRGSDVASAIRLPPGFQLEVYAEDVPGARSMALSPSGVLYVGSREAGRVYAIVDENRDNKADRVVVVDDGLDMPNGVAYKDGSLFVAEVSRILRYGDIDGRYGKGPEPEILYDGFPKDAYHGWKFIRFGPEGLLYVPIGAPCNVCEPQDERYMTIMRMDENFTNAEVYARGVRNTVGFDWDPKTEELWFTDNGRDWLGDDAPDDELNHAPVKGLDFGFPHCHGTDTADPEFGVGGDCTGYTPPAMGLSPHVASLGMRFYEGRMFPEKYRGQIFIAEHGSWNSRTPVGYRVVAVFLEGGNPVSYEVFAEGWLKGNSAWGRPVDVETMPDGSLLLSDDKGGRIYRITYRGQQ